VIRPKCRRCKGPLDFFFDAASNQVEWCCNNPTPLRTDEEFQEAWNNLDGNTVVRLEREAIARGELITT